MAFQRNLGPSSFRFAPQNFSRVTWPSQYKSLRLTRNPIVRTMYIALKVWNYPHPTLIREIRLPHNCANVCVSLFFKRIWSGPFDANCRRPSGWQTWHPHKAKTCQHPYSASIKARHRAMLQVPPKEPRVEALLKVFPQWLRAKALLNMHLKEPPQAPQAEALLNVHLKAPQQAPFLALRKRKKRKPWRPIK